MKIVVGIDTGGLYKPALNLAARLRFPEASWTLVHSVDVAMLAGGYSLPPDASFGPDLIRIATMAGESALDKARDEACAHGIQAETALLTGNPATALATYADTMNVDLVCVQSERKGLLGSLFLGSVSRGLAIGAKHSMLISKGEMAPVGPLRIVWATDQSEYACRALDQFIGMAPKGVGSVRLMTSLHLGGPEVPQELPVARELRDQAEKTMDQDLAKLRAAGYSTTSVILDMPVNEAISTEMRNADLLVMGAQGHGAMHRLILGSVSLHQVVAEPHPVLIMRP